MEPSLPTLEEPQLPHWELYGLELGNSLWEVLVSPRRSLLGSHHLHLLRPEEVTLF